MTCTTMVYKAQSGQWSWSVMDEKRTPIASGGGYASEAEAVAKADSELAEHQSHRTGVLYWRDRFNDHEDGYALIARDLKLSDLSQNMIDGATASKHAAALRSEIQLWQRLIQAQPDPNIGLRADGEPLCGIDSIDYPSDVAHPGNAGLLRHAEPARSGLEVVNKPSEAAIGHQGSKAKPEAR